MNRRLLVTLLIVLVCCSLTDFSNHNSKGDVTSIIDIPKLDYTQISGIAINDNSDFIFMKHLIHLGILSKVNLLYSGKLSDYEPKVDIWFLV